MQLCSLSYAKGVHDCLYVLQAELLDMDCHGPCCFSSICWLDFSCNSLLCTGLTVKSASGKQCVLSHNLGLPFLMLCLAI